MERRDPENGPNQYLLRLAHQRAKAQRKSPSSGLFRELLSMAKPMPRIGNRMKGR